jgi:hypothetical protein
MIRLFLRAFVLVTMVSMNTRQIANGRYGAAFLVGLVISWIWWSNTSKDRPDFKGAGLVYGVGAACGTVAGMWLGR